MTAIHQTVFTKDLANKKLHIVREFSAPLPKVWKAWTDHEDLDQWWAPKPYRAETITMSFKPGGHWLYAMVGPDGSRIWARANYQTVIELKNFTYYDSFCDEYGVPNSDAPSMSWSVTFHDLSEKTKVIVEITFASETDLLKIIEMGLEEGFKMVLGNLDELFAG